MAPCCSADQEKERDEAQTKLKEALLEKEQVSSDLNGMERSFSDLFKRLEKYKEVVEGYKKVRTDGNNERCHKPWKLDLSFHMILGKLQSFMTNCVVCFSSEWRDPESLCSGLPGKDQKGGAALPDPQSSRWGENWPVRNTRLLCVLRCVKPWKMCSDWHMIYCSSSVQMRRLPRCGPRTRLRFQHCKPSCAGSSWRCSRWRRAWTRRWVDMWIRWFVFAEVF